MFWDDSQWGNYSSVKINPEGDYVTKIVKKKLFHWKDLIDVINSLNCQFFQKKKVPTSHLQKTIEDENKSINK